MVRTSPSRKVLVFSSFEAVRRSRRGSTAVLPSAPVGYLCTIGAAQITSLVCRCFFKHLELTLERSYVAGWIDHAWQDMYAYLVHL